MPAVSRAAHTLRCGALQLAFLLALLVAATQSYEVSPLLRGLPTTREFERIQQAQRTRSVLEEIYTFQESQYHTRRLAASTEEDAQARANEIGASVRNSVKRMRGGSDTFYRDLISAVKILLCNEEVKKTGSLDNPKNRFVDESSPLAYKDDKDKCVLVTLTPSSDDTMREEYTKNKKCEVKPNCYWRKIDPLTDVDRVPVYATGHGAQPPDDAMTYDEAEDMAKKWAQGLAIFVVPGIILAVLSLLTMIFFFMCRCCCNRCGGRSPKEGGYTCIAKLLPVLFFLLFSAGIVVVACVSLLYQKTVTAAVTDTFDATSGTLTNASAWINDIQTPLEKIRDKVVSSADSVKLQLDDTSFIDEGITGLTTALSEFEKSSADRTLPAGCTIDKAEKPPLCVPCDFCTTISQQVAAAKQQIVTNAGPGVAALQEVKNTLNKKLVDIKDTVRSSVNEQVENTDEFIVTIDDTREQVDDIQDQFDSQKEAQKAGVLVLFALALAVIALGIIGILLGLTPLKFLANVIHIAYFIGFLALILMFLVSSIFLAVSVGLGDACEITMIFTEDWTVPLGDAAKGVNACFQNESLIDVLGLGDSLDFARGGIKFPDAIDTDTLLDFSSLDKFATEINAVDASTFSLDQTALDELLGLLNDYTKQNDNACVVNDGKYTESNILLPWTANGDTQSPAAITPLEYITARYKPLDQKCVTPGDGRDFMCKDKTTGKEILCAFHELIDDLYTKTSTLVAIKRDAGAFVVELKANMAEVITVTATFKAQTKAMAGKITVIQDDLQSSLIKYVGEFEKAMYCTFIMDGFFEIYGALCGDLMPAFTMISLMLFLAGVFLFPVNVCLIIALKRLKARGNGTLDSLDNEMKFK